MIHWRIESARRGLSTLQRGKTARIGVIPASRRRQSRRQAMPAAGRSTKKAERDRRSGLLQVARGVSAAPIEKVVFDDRTRAGAPHNLAARIQLH